MTFNKGTQQRRLIHPLWVHLPAAAALIALIVYLIRSLPLPSNAPVHFGLNGRPDSYGSPWGVVVASLGLSVFFYYRFRSYR